MGRSRPRRGHQGASDTSSNGEGETPHRRHMGHVTLCATGRDRHPAREGPTDTAHPAACGDALADRVRCRAGKRVYHGNRIGERADVDRHLRSLAYVSGR